LTLSGVSVGHVTKFPALIAASQVVLGGYPAAACRNRIAFGVDGIVYALKALSSLGMELLTLAILLFWWIASFGLNSHSPVSARHPWSSAGSDVSMVIVPSLWIVTPSSLGWKTVVYPSSATFPTLNNDFCRLGSTSTLVAGVGRVGHGSTAFWEPLMKLPSGNHTCLFDGSPVLGKSMVSVAKCDVAPESTIIASSFLLVVVWPNARFVCSTMLLSSSSSSSSSIVDSGAQ